MSRPNDRSFPQIVQTTLAGLLATALAGAQGLVDATPAVLVPPLPPSYYPGAAWGDANGDGWPDLYVTNYYGPNHLFVNMPGAAPGPARVLVDMTPPVLMDALGHGEGAVFADFDNDGDDDLYVVNAGGTPNKLYANLGGTWADASAASGAAYAGIGEGCAVADWDLDGDLDLFVLNYGSTPMGETDRWFRNDGGLVFTDVTPMSMMHGPAPGGACAFADYDLDGDPDLFVGNDGAPNRLFENLGAGTFVDMTPMAGGAALADATGGCFGVRWIDHDADGDLDLYVSNSATFHGTSAVNHLFRNDIVPLGTKTFTLVTSGAEDTGSGMAVTGGDLDRDGAEDLALANFGPNKVFLKAPASTLLRFAPAPAAWFTDPFADTSSSATRCDFDRDGDLDVFFGGTVLYAFTNTGLGPLAIAPSPYTLSVRFRGDRAAPFLVPRDGHGTRAQLVLGSGATTGTPARALQQVDGGSGYSQDAPECFWSIPPAARAGGATPIHDLRIIWADGRPETLMTLPAPTAAAPHARATVHYPAGISFYGPVSLPSVRLVRSSTGTEFTPAQAGAPEFALAAPELADGTLGLLVVGFAPASIPTPFGTLLVDPLATLGAFAPAGVAKWALPIPADPSWVGATLHMQCFVVEPTGAVRSSPGMAAVIQP
jgi:hypothetical protein